MSNKKYKTAENEPMSVKEPAAAYGTAATESAFSDTWNPNVPFHGTQEEWWEHFHRIEEWPFYPASETHQRIAQSFQNKGIVAYTTSGKPLSQGQYIEKIEKAIAEADRNELITDDGLEKEIATW